MFLWVIEHGFGLFLVQEVIRGVELCMNIKSSIITCDQELGFGLEQS